MCYNYTNKEISLSNVNAIFDAIIRLVKIYQCYPIYFLSKIENFFSKNLFIDEKSIHMSVVVFSQAHVKLSTIYIYILYLVFTWNLHLCKKNSLAKLSIDSVRSPRHAINLARLTSFLTSNFTSFVASAKPVQS